MCENTSWEAPLWLSEGFLKNVLKDYLNEDQIEIRKTDIKPATANGESYASVISRVKVEFLKGKLSKKPQEISLIMKYSYESDPSIAKIMSGYDVYNTEMKMYEQILPQLANILQEIGDSEKLFAKAIKVEYEKSLIIFEDLTVQDYILADRLVGLDELHAQRVLQKLAKFHAASVVLNERLHGELQKFQRGIFNRHTRGMGCLFEYLIEVCAKFCLNCPELGSYYHEKLMKIKPHVVDYGINAYSSSTNQFYTLCHGDLWVNNIMMLYGTSAENNNNSYLKDILLIDFQFCNWSSPAVDLHYFFYTSLESKLQLDVHAVNKLVQYYHCILADTLGKLKYKGYIPTLHDLQVQLEESKILAVTAATVCQPIIINDQCDDANFHSLIDDDERSRNFRNILYRNKRLQDHLKILLPYFDQIGLLDVEK